MTGSRKSQTRYSTGNKDSIDIGNWRRTHSHWWLTDWHLHRLILGTKLQYTFIYTHKNKYQIMLAKHHWNLPLATNLHEHWEKTQHHDQYHEGSPDRSATNAVEQTNRAKNLHIFIPDYARKLNIQWQISNLKRQKSRHHNGFFSFFERWVRFL